MKGEKGRATGTVDLAAPKQGHFPAAPGLTQHTVPAVFAPMFTIIGGDGREYGPVPSDQVKRWLAEGRANLSTRAKRVGEETWGTLGDFAEFTAGGTPPPMTPPPVAVAPAAPAYQSPYAAQAATAPQSDLELANRWVRLGAQIVDNIFCMLLMIPGLIWMVIGIVSQQATDPNQIDWVPLVGAVGLICLGVLIVLGIQIWQLTTRGQTVGKRLLGIRIVKYTDDSAPGFVGAFIMRALIPGFIGAIPWVGGLFSLVDICFIFRDDRRCIHDLIAGTKVVTGQPTDTPAGSDFRQI